MIAKEYCARFGFEPIAFSGLETGDRGGYKYLCRINDVNFLFADSVVPYDTDVSDFIKKHGDGVKEVAFSVKDAEGIYNKAMNRGAVSVQPPKTLKDDTGRIVIAKLMGHKTDCVITLVDRTSYTGTFMPGFKQCPFDEPFNKHFPRSSLLKIDHIVQN